MSAFKPKPFPVAVIGAALGLAAGTGWFWLNASRVVGTAVAARRLAEEEQADKIRMRRAQGWDFWTIEIQNLATELADEKARLHKRSDELDQHAARMAAERKELERIRADVEAVRREIDERVVTIRRDETKNLHGLAQTYANLTPHAAVIIMGEMDDASVVKILSLMKPDVVGAIFEDMARTSGPDGVLARRAALISDKLRLMRSGVAPTAVQSGS